MLRRLLPPDVAALAHCTDDPLEWLERLRRRASLTALLRTTAGE